MRARDIIATIYAGRAESEMRAKAAFAEIHDLLRFLRADDVLIDMAASAVDEEQMHTEICTEVASHYARRTIVPSWRPLPPLKFNGTSPELGAVLHVLGVCALSETIGDAMLARTIKDTTEALPRATLLRLMTNEIDHARVGWGLLASRVVDDDLRAQLGGWLPTLSDIALRSWRRRPGVPDRPELAAAGCQSWESIDAVGVDSFSGLILPGFAALGIDTRPAEAWLRGVQPSAPTQGLDSFAAALRLATATAPARNRRSARC
jgi:hypothetical protein